MMKSYIRKYIPDNAWYISADGWDKHIQGIRESQFALGNGYIGSRGILEEVPYDAHPGTYIAGVYDRMGSKVSDLVNLPNPINFKTSIKGEKLDLSTMSHIKHQRYINMKHGLLLRHTIYETAAGNKIDYQSVRFFSMVDKNIAVIRIYITPVNKPCAIAINSDIDTSVSNVSGISEGRKTHFEIRDVVSSEKNTISYIRVQTFTHKISVSYAHSLHISLDKKSWYSKDENLILKLKKNQTVVFTKIYSILSKEELEPFDIKQKTIKNLENGISLGFDKLLKRHIHAWENIWRRSDIVIKGKSDLQKNIRFSLYHLLIAGIDDNGKTSIGARTLSGEGYRGHVFWDSEIFIIPFFLFTQPHIAKSMLLYRAKRLDKAKKIAALKGYAGAMFPWESALTGEEETPSWARNLDGSLVEIHTHEMECHITADIAYATYRYYVATDDEDFMFQYGYELLCETARFWSSKVTYNKRKKRYEIHHVIGPDEFHEGVDNNAYTNLMARWNIFIAYSMCMKMKKKHPKFHAIFVKRTGLNNKELEKWKDIIAKMHVNIRGDKIIEQFEGFFKKERIKITQLDENLMPVIPQNIRLKNISKYQIVKQADIIMLLYLLSDNFDLKTKKANYNFYAPVTVHKSSLSPAMHSLMASEIGEFAKAYRYFLISLDADLANLHRNTREGVHAANLGGTWQALIHGFAGVRIIKETLSLNPRLPKEIKEINFSIYWKRYILNMRISKKEIRIKCSSVSKAKKRPLRLRVYGRMYNISPKSKNYMFKKGK